MLLLFLLLQQVPDDYGPTPDDYGPTPQAQKQPDAPPPPALEAPARYTPILELAWRRFSIGRAGEPMPDANASMDGLLFEWYPISSYLRLGLSTELARENSARDQHDWYVAEHVSLGVQYPAVITPFVEGSVGAGYYKRFVVGQEQPTGMWAFGVFGGALVHFSGPAFVSVSLGWMRPVWVLYGTDSMSIGVQEIYRDTLAFKLGVGF